MSGSCCTKVYEYAVACLSHFLLGRRSIQSQADPDEIVHKSDYYLDVTNGYAWFSYGKNKFLPPPQPIPDPAFKFGDWGWTAILIGRFVGPHGPFDYVCHSQE